MRLILIFFAIVSSYIATGTLFAQDSSKQSKLPEKSIKELIKELELRTLDSTKSTEYIGDFDLKPTATGSTTKFLPPDYKPSRHDKGYNSDINLEEYRQRQKDAEVRLYTEYFVKCLLFITALVIVYHIVKRYFY